MFDFTVSGLAFSSTEITVTAVTDKGREWCADNICTGAVGATYRKSMAGEILSRIERNGLKWVEA
jgi:hypothetical protein